MGIGNAENNIYFKNASLHYGSGNIKLPVLVGMDMCIPKGSIYGLLGPSGCGKTTLIHCIVGKKKLASGELTVFGGTPGSIESGIPGGRVGYMPQELALICELTLKETLKYFGKTFGMSKERIDSRSDFLIDLLDLPREDKLIRNLSGGQQRRVSLAAALIHEPELLILDEPTVGVDPVLRRCIWSHLLEIIKASSFQKTIVITTHYIEEARQANIICMMRFGKLLAEGPPEQLLLSYNKPTLEEVFILLCLTDQNKKKSAEKLQAETREIYKKRKKGKIVQISEVKPEEDIAMSSRSVSVKNDVLANNNYKSRKWYALSSHRMVALFIRNIIRIRRSGAFLASLLIIPVLDLTTFYVAFGHQPRDLTLAIVSEEIYTDSCERPTNDCIFYSSLATYKQDRELSCRYIAYLDDRVQPVFYDNLIDAEQAVRAGKHWGVMHFQENYTNTFIKRYTNTLFDIDEDISNQSDIHVSLDMSNQVVGAFIQLQISEAYQKFANNLLTACNLKTKMARLPIVYKPPIYGPQEPTFTEFGIPGMILNLAYYLSVGNTALAFVMDKRDGVTDRGWIAGVTAAEVVLSFLIVNFAILIAQVAMMLAVTIVVFQNHVQGSLINCLLLLLLQGVCGMTLGLVISASVDTEHEAMMIVLGNLLFSLHICGTIWPLEGMPKLMRYFSYMLPNTLASEALRSITARGWDHSWVQIDVAYLATIIWIVVHVSITVLIIQLRR